MSLQTRTFATPWDGSSAPPTFSEPADLISSVITFYAEGGNTDLTYGAYVSGTIPVSELPLTVLVGSPSLTNSTSGNPSNGGNGFSGGGGAGDLGETLFEWGGGGSTAILSGTTGSYTLLTEAGGGNGNVRFYAGGTLGAPCDVWGGTGGGYASTTAPAVTSSGPSGPGSGGAIGGNGGNGGNGATWEAGGIGFGILSGGSNGNNGTAGGTAGAGVGSGGLPVSNAGNCYLGTGIEGSYGPNGAQGPRVVFTYRIADAPSIIEFASPASGSLLDLANNGVTLFGRYSAPSGDTGVLDAVSVKVVDNTTSTNYFWNGTALTVSGIPYITPTTGDFATNGAEFSVVIPPGIFIDGHDYTLSVSTQEANAGLQSGYGLGVSVQAIQFPSAVITGPANGSFVNSLTPTIAWSNTLPGGGAQTGKRILIYTEPQDISTLPVSLTSVVPPGAIFDTHSSGSLPAFTMPANNGLQSIETYYLYLLVQVTISATIVYAPWVGSEFTVELTGLPTPTLTAVPVTEPTSGAPSALLTMEAFDNLQQPVGSSLEGIYAPSALSNCVVSPDLSWAIQGLFSLAVQCTVAGTMEVDFDKMKAVAGDTVSVRAEVNTKVAARTASLLLKWYNSSNTLLRTDTIASGSDSAATLLSGANGTAAPTGTDHVVPCVSWASCALGEVHRVDAVSTAFGTPTQWWYGVGDGAGGTVETTEWQADYTGDGTWQDILPAVPQPFSTFLDDVGSRSDAYDMGAPFNVPIFYRCRNLVALESYSASGVQYPAQQVVSAWSDADEALVPSDYWWIVPPTQPENAMPLMRLQSAAGVSPSSLTSPVTPPVAGGLTVSFASDKQEQLGVFRPFGKPTATFVHGDIWDEEFDLSLYFDSPEAWAAFVAIRELQAVVLLKSDMEGSLYWVTMGPDLNAGIFRRTDRRQNPTRGVTVHCTPTDPFVT